MRILWRNVPIPEPFVLALAGGGLLHVLAPVSFLRPSPVRFVAGAGLIIAGVGTAAWAAVTAQENDLEHPTTLLTTGPYAASRNPMYAGWASFAMGLSLVAGSPGLAVGTVAALAWLQKVTIPKEEQALQADFGEAYSAYRRRVPRWV